MTEKSIDAEKCGWCPWAMTGVVLIVLGAGGLGGLFAMLLALGIVLFVGALAEALSNGSKI